LSNVVRHAGASRVEVKISVRGSQVAVAVVDNGCGGAAESGGLRNLRGRAEQLGGQFSVTDVEPNGTRVMWCVSWVIGGL
jgi:signal transduction histidine kinase